MTSAWLTKSTLRLAVLCVLSALLLAGIVLVSGASVSETLSKLWDSAFGNPMKISATLRETAPLWIAGLAVFVALKAGMFNIGVEGQITIGALCAAAAALPFDSKLGMILGVLAGVAGGALWAFPAAWIKAYRGGHEVISTIMLNNIAAGLALALVAGPLKDPSQEGTTTRDLGSGSHLPLLLDAGKWQVSWVLPLAALALFGAAVWLKRSVNGFELRLVGENDRAAQFAGVDVRRVQLRSLVASGAIGGLAGSIQVLAFEHRFFDGISSGYGFDALGVALLAGNSPIGILGSGLLFGVLNKSSSAIQLLGIPKGMTWIVLAVLVIVFAAFRYRKEAK